MTRHYEIELKAHPAEARRARARTRERLADWGLDELVETAELLVSELVANALVHTTTPARLRLVYHHAVYHHALRLEVSDLSNGTPQRQDADVDESHGRGLELIHLFSDRWDWHTDDIGKTVWCEVDAPGVRAA